MTGFSLSALVWATTPGFADDLLPTFTRSSAPIFTQPTAAAVAAFQTTEYFANYGLNSINAAPAYAKGFTGSGELIAVLDTGIDPNHPEFANAISPASKMFGSVGGPLRDNDLPDPNKGNVGSHGTHVAAIAAAAKDGAGMQGVAYNARILALGVIGLADANTSDAVDYATSQKATVLNGSYGPSTLEQFITDPNNPKNTIPNPDYKVLQIQTYTAHDQTDYAAIKRAEDSGMVLVFAAGNDRVGQPVIAQNPSGPALYPYIKPANATTGVYNTDGTVLDLSASLGPLIAVVATDKNNQIADFSNLCGVAAAWCIAAPGVDIYAAIQGGGYGLESGTSMAAPMVAGAAAVVRQAFPFLTATQVAQTLFTTATNIGPAAIYGWGLLNLGKAVDGPGQFTMDWTVDTQGFSGTFVNNINGIGGLTKQGPGTLVLAGTNTYAGATSVTAGVLQVDGSITSAATVSNTGVLAGSGTLAGIAMQAGGTLSPGSGNTMATMTSNGPVSFTPGSFFRVKVTPTDNDRLAVNGSATLTGGTVQAIIGAGTYGYETLGTILTATGGVSGQFAGATTSSAFLTPQLAYASTAVALSLSRNNVSFAAVAVDSNQSAVGTAIQAAANRFVATPQVVAAQASVTTAGATTASATTASVAPVAFTAAATTENAVLFNVAAESAGGARATEDMLSGQGLTGTAGAGLQASGQFGNVISAQTNNLNPAATVTRTVVPADDTPRPLAYADASVAQSPIQLRTPPLAGPAWSAWTIGFGGGQTLSANNSLGTVGQTGRFGGGVAGLDYRFSPSLLIGVAGGGSGSSFAVPALSTSGTATGGHAALYAIAMVGSFYGQANVTYSGFSNATTRQIAGFNAENGETEKASFSSNVVRGRAEAGRRFDIAKRVVDGITPFAAIEVARFRSAGYVEQSASGGPGVLGLTVPGQGLTSVPSFVGLRLDGAYRIGAGMSVTTFISAAYVHEFSPARTLAASLTSLPGASFVVDGARPARDGAQVVTGVQLAITEKITVFAGFNGDLATTAKTYAGNGGIRLAW